MNNEEKNDITYFTNTKEDRIVIRIPTEIKEQLNEILLKKGTNTSDYLRQYIYDTIKKESILNNGCAIIDKSIPTHYELALHNLEERISKIEKTLGIKWNNKKIKAYII